MILTDLSICSNDDLPLARAALRRVADRLGLELHDRVGLVNAVTDGLRRILGQQVDASMSVAVSSTQPHRLEITLRPTSSGDCSPSLAPKIRLPVGRAAGVLPLRSERDDEADDIGMLTLTRELSRAASKAELIALQEEMQTFQLDLVEENERQDQELASALETLEEIEETLAGVVHELEETNRGFLALYRQMEEQAERLREVDALKDRFISFLSHEFRTPVSAITAISRLLLDRVDGELTDEQDKQVRLVSQAARDLAVIARDLLDLAHVQAGHLTVNATWFGVADLFSTLRGMMRPLTTKPDVRLVFEDVDPGLELCSDEVKVSQILRNFLTNALKFTERGTVTLRGYRGDDEGEAVFEVSDTGVGIAPENQTWIFQPFAQIDNDRRKLIRGTGLGLPLSRELAELLGGRVEVDSEVGKGSTFRLVLPLTAASVASSCTDDEEGP